MQKGLCTTHYSRMRAHGDPTKILRNPPRKIEDRVCSVDGCKRKYHGKGYCGLHLARFNRHGSPDNALVVRGEIRAFLESAVKTISDDCIIWPYTKNPAGHGQIYWDGRLQTAHRIALSLHTGKAPKDKQACHGPCHNPACINPLHLYWGTPKQNSNDRLRDGTSCRGLDHPAVKLTEVQVFEIFSDPRPHKEIASDHEITKSYVSTLKRSKTWGHTTVGFSSVVC